MKWKCPDCDKEYDTEKELSRCIYLHDLQVQAYNRRIALKDNKNQPAQAVDKSNLTSLTTKEYKEDNKWLLRLLYAFIFLFFGGRIIIGLLIWFWRFRL